MISFSGRKPNGTFNGHFGIHGWTASRDELVDGSLAHDRIFQERLAVWMDPFVTGAPVIVRHAWNWLFPSDPNLPSSQRPKVYVCADTDIPCQQGTSPPTVCIDGCAVYEINGLINLQNNPWGTSWSNAFRSGSVSWVRDGIPIGTGGGREGPGGGTYGPFGDLPCPEGPGEV